MDNFLIKNHNVLFILGFGFLMASPKGTMGLITVIISLILMIGAIIGANIKK